MSSEFRIMDTQRTDRGHLSAARRLSVHEVALHHGIPPRKLLRRIVEVLRFEGQPSAGPFEIAVESIGVEARRDVGASRVTYAVLDQDALVRWYRYSESVQLDASDARNIASLLDHLLKAAPREKVSPKARQAALKWIKTFHPSPSTA